MRWLPTLIAVLVVTVLAACDNGTPDPPADIAPLEDNAGVFDPMVDTLDRAKAVEDLQQQRSGDIDAAVDESGR